MSDVNEHLIAHLKARAIEGMAEYGVPLLPFNGRNPLRDKREELLDALVYNEQDIMEREAIASLLIEAADILATVLAESRVFGMRRDNGFEFLGKLQGMAIKLQQDIKRIEPEWA